MGFGNSYKVLSPLSWESNKQSGSPSSPGVGSGDGSKRLVDFVKRWLLCGWKLDDSGASPTGKNGGRVSPDGYVRPPRWRLFLRRVRARTRKVQAACCEGLCFHPQQQPLNYCSTDSYERNFDRGREYWSDDFGAGGGGGGERVKNPGFAAPVSYASTALHSTSSSTPILWEEESTTAAGAPAPIWQRRMVSEHHLAPIAVAAA